MPSRAGRDRAGQARPGHARGERGRRGVDVPVVRLWLREGAWVGDGVECLQGGSSLGGGAPTVHRWLDEKLMPVPLCVADAAGSAVSHTGDRGTAAAAGIPPAACAQSECVRLLLPPVREGVPRRETETQPEASPDDPLGGKALSLPVLSAPIQPEEQPKDAHPQGAPRPDRGARRAQGTGRPDPGQAGRLGWRGRARGGDLEGEGAMGRSGEKGLEGDVSRGR